MPCADEEFVDVGLRGGPLDAAHRGRLADVVDLADDGQHRAVDVGQRHQVAVDGEAAGHHPVVRDELLEQLGDGGPGPGDPALGGQESALLFAGQQRLAVVQLAQEVQPRLRGLDRVEHLEAGARQPARDVDPAEDVVGHEVGGRGREARRQVHRQCRPACRPVHRTRRCWRGPWTGGRPRSGRRTCRPASSRPGGRRGR